ncbi:MAG: hypothetical protein QXL04_02855 [Metallosphaera sp.]
MSELDFLLNRKKRDGGVQGVDNSPQRVDNRVQGVDNSPQRVDNRVQGVDNSPQRVDNTIDSGADKSPMISLENQNVKRDQRLEDEELELMRKFLDKDPKIGIWSYPSYVVLQYLFNTRPGFKISKVAKEALEIGMRQLFPDLYTKAELITKQRGLVK